MVVLQGINDEISKSCYAVSGGVVPAVFPLETVAGSVLHYSLAVLVGRSLLYFDDLSRAGLVRLCPVIMWRNAPETFTGLLRAYGALTSCNG